jgi:N6-L-threonylcarbamoyladenine synthase
MLILGIDTSCDDTSAAVVEDGRRILSNVVSSQADIHAKYGGIVPELASRRHIEMILPVVDEALKGAGIGLSDVDAVAVCRGPGLIGSLLVGCSWAKAACYATGLPLIAVNHLEGHVLSVFLQEPAPSFPFLSLIVSGGHTSLFVVEGFGSYIELGRTRDDAAGEAYDKVSKLLGLGYPGGPVIDALARDGDAGAIDFPRAYLPETFDFSFSGLKTAVLNHVRSRAAGTHGGVGGASPSEDSVSRPSRMSDVAASFQRAVVDVLVRKTEWAVRKKWIRQVAVSGGVAANSELRRKMTEMGEAKGVDVYVPPLLLCTDNAAMIAVAGYHRFMKGELAGLDLNPQAYLPL